MIDLTVTKSAQFTRREQRLSAISGDEWDTIKKIMELLETCEKYVTYHSGSKYTTLSTVRKSMAIIINHCCEIQESTENAVIKQAAINIKLKCTSYLEKLTTTFQNVSQYFDNRIPNRESLENAVREVCEFYNIGDDLGVADVDEVNGFDQMFGIERDIVETGLEEEFKIYRVEKSKVEPSLYWRTMTKTLPNLSKLAKLFISIPASSVPSEEVFSDAGNIVTEKRTRLKPRSVRSMMCLKSWNKSNIF